MNMNTRTSTRELYRNRDNSPLDRVQIRRVAPSVFADREDDSRSEKYRFVSSDSLLDQMEEGPGSSLSEPRNSVPGNRTAHLHANT